MLQDTRRWQGARFYVTVPGCFYCTGKAIKSGSWCGDLWSKHTKPLRTCLFERWVRFSEQSKADSGRSRPCPIDMATVNWNASQECYVQCWTKAIIVDPSQ